MVTAEFPQSLQALQKLYTQAKETMTVRNFLNNGC